MNSAPSVHAFGTIRGQKTTALGPAPLILFLQCNRPRRILSSLYAMGGTIAQSSVSGQAYLPESPGAPVARPIESPQAYTRRPSTNARRLKES